MGFNSAKKIVFSLVFYVFGLSVASAKEITVGMGNFEPYFIERGNRGVFAEIITEVFRNMPDYEPKFIFGYSNKGLLANLNKGRIDAAANLFDEVAINGCKSDPVFRFRDVAITRLDSKIDLDSVADLKGRGVVTFEGAKGFFGESFSKNTLSSSYMEVSKPALQVRMLWNKRADVSVGDMFIFLHELKLMGDPSVTASNFKYHYIFPVISSRLGFVDHELCVEFNSALKKVVSSGKYEEIYESYLMDLNYN